MVRALRAGEVLRARRLPRGALHCRGLGATQEVSPRSSSAQVADDKGEGTRAGETPGGQAAHPTDVFLLL